MSLQNSMRGIVDIGCMSVESLLVEVVELLVLEPPEPLVSWLVPVVVESLGTMIGLVSIIASTRLAVPPSSK